MRGAADLVYCLYTARTKVLIWLHWAWSFGRKTDGASSVFEWLRIYTPRIRTEFHTIPSLVRVSIVPAADPTS
jgi:hypothetical protein